MRAAPRSMQGEDLTCFDLRCEMRSDLRARAGGWTSLRKAKKDNHQGSTSYPLKMQPQFLLSWCLPSRRVFGVPDAEIGRLLARSTTCRRCNSFSLNAMIDIVCFLYSLLATSIEIVPLNISDTEPSHEPTSYYFKLLYSPIHSIPSIPLSSLVP